MNWRDKIEPGVHGFAERITKLPVDCLGRNGFRLTFDRKRWLSPAELNSLFAENQAMTLVIARIGSAFRWYDEGDYRFWAHEGADHTADPGGFSMDEFPNKRAYLPSVWGCRGEPRSEVIILFEEYH